LESLLSECAAVLSDIQSREILNQMRTTLRPTLVHWMSTAGAFQPTLDQRVVDVFDAQAAIALIDAKLD
jgi:hypothetical protein